MPITSTRPSVTIPECSLYEHIFGTLTEEDAQRTAIIDSATGSETSYGQLKAMVDAFAGALAQRGVQPKDVVALHCPNTMAFAVAFHGIMRAGATVTTVGSLATAKDITNQLTDSGASMLFTTSLLGQAGFEAAKAVGIEPQNVIDITDPNTGLASLLGEANPAPDTEIDAAQHLAVLPYSSGTTGVPKGVMLSHRNLVANIAQMLPALADIGLSRDSVVMGVLPFFHIYGMNVLLNTTLAIRGAIVTMPKMDLPEFLQLHQDYGIDFSFIAPPIAVALAKHPVVDNYDLSALKFVQSGAAALDRDLAAAVEQRLDVTMVQGFGMTEASPVTHNSLAGITPLDSIGSPLAETECKVVDLERDDFPEILPPTEQGERSAAGELWVRGPQVMVGYLNNEEATRNTITEDGWLRTGDVVEYDHEGNVYVVDRAKELIKYKGYQVAPAELEALILTRADVADVAVVGFTREEDGEEVPRAFVVPQRGAQIDPEELLAWIAERVAAYKKVRIVEFIDEIPKSATGKILRKNLKVLPLNA